MRRRIISITVHRAAGTYTCAFCGQQIHEGGEYQRWAVASNGNVQTVHVHLSCYDILIDEAGLDSLDELPHSIDKLLAWARRQEDLWSELKYAEVLYDWGDNEAYRLFTLFRRELRARDDTGMGAVEALFWAVVVIGVAAAIYNMLR